MRERILMTLSHWHASYPWRMIAIAVLITVILGVFASQLTITMRTQDLLPEGDPRVDQFNRIIDEFATATSIIVVVQGEESRIKAFADDLAPRLLELRDGSHNERFQEEIGSLKEKINKLKDRKNGEARVAELESEIAYARKRIDMPLFQRVDYKLEADFLRNHALMLIEEDDLKDIKDLFTNPNLSELITNINDSMEKEYVGQEESISTREREDGAVGFLDGIENLVSQLQRAARGDDLTRGEVEAAADKFLLGEPYFLSYDKTALILNVIPNFTIMDRDLIMVGTESVQSLVEELLEEYSDVRAGLSGDIAREHDEQVYSQRSLGYTTIIAFVAILAILIISFRMWIAPVLAMINLFAGLIWAMGAAFLAVGQLNMMTAMLSVVLLGLGIDFSIHIISGFTEWRAAGDTIPTALEKTFLKSGKGVITGALTTACAFLALLISRSRGMKEMGIVTGVGLLSVMLASFLFLPVLLVFRERLIDWRREKKYVKFVQRDISFRSLGRVSTWLGKRYAFTIVAAVIVSSLLIWSAFHIGYEQNYMKMEPKGLTSIALTDTVVEKFDLSLEYALCLAESVEESRELAEKYRDLGTVAMTNDISVYLPSKEEQEERVPHILEIRERMASAALRRVVREGELPVLNREIDRLEMNIMEMQDMAFLGGQDKVDTKCKAIVGDPEDPESISMVRELAELLSADPSRSVRGLSRIQRTFAPYFRQCVLRMCSTEPIQLEDLPASVLDRYSNNRRNLFMITIYPSGQLFEDVTVLNRFVDDVARVDPRTTGSPPVAIAWMRIAAQDGRNAIVLTLVIVFLLLWFDFRRPWYALIAMVPLALGVFWMVGLMQLSGMLLNFMTMMGLPLIIGIGIDDGVHIMHRWQHEGRGKIMTVFSSTGKAILLTSLTTMLAFGSMIFSLFPAWSWFGSSLFIGVGACFLTTVIVLSGILGFIERSKTN
jgi:predicted RND superfamily exporter protein